MGAWQPFQTKPSGYIPVTDTPTKAPPPTSSGFSRVGGGRAHIDSPYAIAGGSTINAGSTQTFPSIAQQVSQPNASSPSLKRLSDEEDTPSLSANTAIRQQQEYHARTGSLPPGAMPPFHVRTKSQTAIIEHAGGVSQAGPSYPTGPAIRPVRDPTPPPTAFNLRHSNPNPVDDDDGSDTDVPKKKPWYHLRRHRPHSSEGTTSTAKPPDEEAPPNLPPVSTSAPQRSFVVIRKPQQSPGRSQKLSTGSEPANLSPSAAGEPSVPTRRSYPSHPGS